MVESHQCLNFWPGDMGAVVSQPQSTPLPASRRSTRCAAVITSAISSFLFSQNIGTMITCGTPAAVASLNLP